MSGFQMWFFFLSNNSTKKGPISYAISASAVEIMCQVSFFNQSGNITLYKTVSWFKKECIWQVLFMELPSHTKYTNIHHTIIIGGKKPQQQIFQNHVFLKTTALEQAESKANMIQQCTQLDQQPIQRAWSIFFHKPWWKYKITLWLEVDALLSFSSGLWCGCLAGSFTGSLLPGMTPFTI